MAVLKIKVASIIGRLHELDRVTAICGRSEVFHPDNVSSFYKNAKDFVSINEENPFANLLSRLNETVTSIGKKVVLLDQDKRDKLCFSDAQLNDYIAHLDDLFGTLKSEYSTLLEQKRSLQSEIEKISHFMGLNLNLSEIFACKYIKVRFGWLSAQSYGMLNHYGQNPFVAFFPCTHDRENYWGVYFSPIEEVSEVDHIFARLGFERTKLTKDLAGSPEEAVTILKSQESAAEERLNQLSQQLDDLWIHEEKTCIEVYSALYEKCAYFKIRSYAQKYNDNFLLIGWIPAESEENFRKQLNTCETVECTIEDAKRELSHAPPIKLKNNRLFKPFEFFVDMYGLPSYNEVDPTPLVALTYIVLFGIMFADVGQGLAVALLGYIMYKFKNMKLGAVLVPCGISSAIFGLCFGSVFGFEHALDPMYKSLFGLDEKPIEVMNPSTTNLIIYSAVGIGVFLVLVAILINIYSSLKRKKYENALFGPNGVAGLVFYGSIVFGLGGQLLFNMKILTVPYICAFTVAPIAVMFFREVLGGLVERRGDWKPESWGDYLMQNFFEVFEFLLSYATNTMSFLRVGAFVLVHAGMMMVVFTLAEMTSGIASIVIIIIGNLFVTALEGLLVGIQALRLEFYEMFSRFFDGEGRPFEPVRVTAQP